MRGSNVNIVGMSTLSISQVKKEYPLMPELETSIGESRQTVERILAGEDRRLLVIVGPCSIHNKQAALEYGTKLVSLADELKDELYIVMRAYFAKPRTTIGWKGLFNDPKLDRSFDQLAGMKLAREILLELARMGLPLATEYLDPFTCESISDLITWGAIGARTTESQVHRELASGLSMPIGFKNTTEGGQGAIVKAADAVETANHPHEFLGINGDDRVAIVKTTGNKWAHVVLRGGAECKNYEHFSIQGASTLLANRGLLSSVIVDCAHDNCLNSDGKKDPEEQRRVFELLVDNHVQDLTPTLVGVMLESHLKAGKQTLSNAPTQKEIDGLKYDQSITDPCIGWDDTERILREARDLLAAGGH